MVESSGISFKYLCSSFKEPFCFIMGVEWVKQLRASKWGKMERKVRSSRAYFSLVILATLYAVFANDLRLLFLPKSADLTVDAIFYLCFGLFTLDITFSACFEPRYFGSLIFLLDIVATASMVIQPLLDSGSQQSKRIAIARLARVVRLLRIMRVTRFAMASSDVAIKQAQNTKKRIL